MTIKHHVNQLQTEGFTVVAIRDHEKLIDQVNQDIDHLVNSGSFRTNSKFYSYNASPRIVESWKHSKAARRLAYDQQIIDVLTEFFKAPVKPFSTINFLRSTQQPLHSDYVHFGTDPAFHLAAAWIALEDIDPRSGPIQLVPKSHLWPEFLYSQIGIPIARSLGDVESNYREYESWVRKDLETRGVAPITPEVKKGDAILWVANLVHGSPTCDDPKLSRRSQVIHYHTSEVKLFYNPVFSDPVRGKFYRRTVNFFESK